MELSERIKRKLCYKIREEKNTPHVPKFNCCNFVTKVISNIAQPIINCIAPRNDDDQEIAYNTTDLSINVPIECDLSDTNTSLDSYGINSLEIINELHENHLENQLEFINITQAEDCLNTIVIAEREQAETQEYPVDDLDFESEIVNKTSLKYLKSLISISILLIIFIYFNFFTDMIIIS